ncbi:MAG: XylR N-terminal domain-containing protein [Thermoleophilia bacterium]
MDPDLRQLRAFVAVAEERSFTHGARRLRLSQQSTSALVRKLEDALGAPLLVRTSRRVELTPAGAALLDEARALLAAAGDAVSRVRAVAGHEAVAFDLGDELRLDPDRGVASFRDARMAILNADALGALRETLIERLGLAGAREVLFGVGYAHGVADYRQFDPSGKGADVRGLSELGPAMHAWEGLVHADPLALRFDRDGGIVDAAGTWTNSLEAEQHRRLALPVDGPVCWTLAGYASGWGSSLLGVPVLVLETACVGAGDHVCRWRIRELAAWGDEAAAFRPALERAARQASRPARRP